MFKQIFVNRKPGPRIKDCGMFINWYSVVINLMDDTRMTSMKIIQFSRPFTPLVQLCPKLFHPHDLGRPISNEPPLPLPPPRHLTIYFWHLTIYFYVALHSCLCSYQKISQNVSWKMLFLVLILQSPVSFA